MTDCILSSADVLFGFEKPTRKGIKDVINQLTKELMASGMSKKAAKKIIKEQFKELLALRKMF